VKVQDIMREIQAGHLSCHSASAGETATPTSKLGASRLMQETEADLQGRQPSVNPINQQNQQVQTGTSSNHDSTPILGLTISTLSNHQTTLKAAIKLSQRSNNCPQEQPPWLQSRGQVLTGLHMDHYTAEAHQQLTP
jgi:hypothetical protein